MAKHTTSSGGNRTSRPERRAPLGDKTTGARSGAEAVPPGAETEHSSEPESGYGGKNGGPRVSADQPKQ